MNTDIVVYNYTDVKSSREINENHIRMYPLYYHIKFEYGYRYPYWCLNGYEYRIIRISAIRFPSLGTRPPVSGAAGDAATVWMARGAARTRGPPGSVWFSCDYMCLPVWNFKLFWFGPCVATREASGNSELEAVRHGCCSRIIQMEVPACHKSCDPHATAAGYDRGIRA